MLRVMFKALAVLALLSTLPMPKAPRPQPSPDGALEILSMPNVENAYPHWSRDGSRLLFQSNRTGKWQLHIMNADGSGDRLAFQSAFDDNFPDWSPDNSRIAFVSNRSGDEDVWVVGMDGKAPRNLTHHRGRDIHPFWTPDGKRILFNSTRKSGEHFDVWSIAPDGSGLALVQGDDREKTCARLSPRGDRIVYLRAERNDEVFAMNADGTHGVNLTRSPQAEGWPTWTPDGKRIVYGSERDGRFALCVMNADGSGVRQISFPPAGAYDARPSLSADGKKIAFNRQYGRTIAICVMPMPTSR